MKNIGIAKYVSRITDIVRNCAGSRRKVAYIALIKTNEKTHNKKKVIRLYFFASICLIVKAAQIIVFSVSLSKK